MAALKSGSRFQWGPKDALALLRHTTKRETIETLVRNPKCPERLKKALTEELEKPGDWGKSNRPVKVSEVIKYARDMSTGRWQAKNGQANIFPFDSTGRCRGQHRALATIEAQYTWSEVEFVQVTPAALNTTDIGHAWVLSEHLAGDDSPNSSKISSIVNTCLRYRGLRGDLSLTEVEKMEFAAEHADVLDTALTLALPVDRRKWCGITLAMIGCFAFEAIEQSYEKDVTNFLFALAVEGEDSPNGGVYRTHACKKLTEKLRKNYGAGQKLRAEDGVRYLIAAFNVYIGVDGKTTPRWPSAGYRPEFGTVPSTKKKAVTKAVAA